MSPQSVEVLCQHGFDTDSLASSREALKCLANIFLHESKTRQMFVEAKFAGKAAERLKVYELSFLFNYCQGAKAQGRVTILKMNY